ncbi:DAK2 domain-containing protein [Rhodococcus maanshanensis]|uniref:DAK2 domain-containing protein n=1 Tax=Rhodococcus maanshanensis TaxID=183556 RepID=UPI0022B2F03A|nr:DAK2 domain-containing protein [Rhodococcus maanshanensis]MCZ4554378.1 DAK2 domain-containing protein [Rhodococcus maanshanensis]
MLIALDSVDGEALLRWSRWCVDGLVARCEEINSLNVFPVPDSDTGTNLLFTMRAAAEGAEVVGPAASVGAVAAAMARGAVAGARGNSGVILSQVLRGIAEVAGDEPLDARLLRGALNEAAVLATEAISIPVEGTIVTVLRHAAAAADGCPHDAALSVVAAEAADAAAEALARTPSQLSVLGAAGVVDAGGLGLLVILDALVGVVTGATPERQDIVVAPVTLATPGVVVPPSACTDEPGEQDYEVMYLLSGSDSRRVDTLRSRLGELGDSVIIVGDGEGSWSVHVHCSDPGPAVEAGLAAGRTHDIRISCFALDETRAGRVGRRAGATDRGVLAIVAGDGAADLFAGEGAMVLRCDEPVTPDQLLDAIRALDCGEVLVLPNGALSAPELVTIGVAARDESHEVLLLPCSSMVQGLAALAVHDPGRAAVDDVFAMSEAAATTRWGSLRVATERALTLMGTCEAGDGLGLIGREVVVIAPDPAEAGRRLIDQVLGVGGELLTLLLGAEIPAGFADLLSEHVAARHPGVEVLVYEGGQAGDLLQLGVE